MKSYTEVLSYLYGIESKIDLGLERVEKLLKAFGNPHTKIKFVHVAGTNGKGSVASMIAALLKEAGYKVGKYTSPHLVNFTERIIVGEEEIEKDKVVEIFNKLKPEIDKLKPTYFEIVTVMALLHFAEQKVDYAVLEVGLGGRLDATNVIVPKVTVITNVDLDHQEHLGNTKKEIANEKAGIIKKNIPVITLAKDEALKIIKAQAKKMSARVVVPKFAFDTNLNGEYQRWNAALAVEAFKALGIRGSKQVIRGALNRIVWPGRLQRIDQVLLDCAHNPHAMEALAEYLKEANFKKLYIIFGALDDKNIKDMILPIEKYATMIILTKPDYHRAIEPEKIGMHLKSFLIQPTVKDALTFANNISGDDGLVLVTGSCYMVGEALRTILGKEPELPPVIKIKPATPKIAQPKTAQHKTQGPKPQNNKRLQRNNQNNNRQRGRNPKYQSRNRPHQKQNKAQPHQINKAQPQQINKPQSSRPKPQSSTTAKTKSAAKTVQKDKKIKPRKEINKPVQQPKKPLLRNPFRRRPKPSTSATTTAPKQNTNPTSKTNTKPNIPNGRATANTNKHKPSPKTSKQNNQSITKKTSNQKSNPKKPVQKTNTQARAKINKPKSN